MGSKSRRLLNQSTHSSVANRRLLMTTLGRTIDWALGPLAGQNLTPLMSITNMISPSLSWVMSTSSWNCRLG